jgi:hypothetical protein
MAWDASLFGVTVLAQFVQATLPNPVGPPGSTLGWLAYTQVPPWQNPAVPPGGVLKTVPQELDELQLLAEYRPEVLSEALAQSTDPVGFWAGLLMFSPYSHPWTFRLARTAIVVGEFLAMHYKRQQNRARPSQLSPALMPPVAVPGHASYPSGHATQAYLVSRLLADVMPDQVKFDLNPTPSALTTTRPASLLDRLAERVARNREVLGLHYPSDSECGRNLANAAYDLLQTCALINNAATGAKALAKLEWP